jgi:hypothetical protein
MNFEEKIQKWVSIDNQMKIMSEKMKELRDKKNQLEEVILQHANNNNLSNAVIQISDGKLKFANTKVSSALTFRYLEKSLGEIIKNEAQVKQILEYLKEKREYKVVPEIKRITNNNS